MENLICVLKDAEEVKQSGSYEIPREINTVENYTQHLSITDVNSFFSSKQSVKGLDLFDSYTNFDFKKKCYTQCFIIIH